MEKPVARVFGEGGGCWLVGLNHLQILVFVCVVSFLLLSLALSISALSFLLPCDQIAYTCSLPIL